MARGGARNRSGPRKDPNSARSEKLGVRFGKLPRAGFSGRPPAWPLTTPATASERVVWKAAWKTPQAAAWATEPWRHRSVALWCRWTVRMEAADAPAAVATATRQLADQIGLTPAGLNENGWVIEEAPSSHLVGGEPAPEPSKVPTPPPTASDPRVRLRVVNDAGD